MKNQRPGVPDSMNQFFRWYLGNLANFKTLGISILALVVLIFTHPQSFYWSYTMCVCNTLWWNILALVIWRRLARFTKISFYIVFFAHFFVPLIIMMRASNDLWFVKVIQLSALEFQLMKIYFFAHRGFF